MQDAGLTLELRRRLARTAGGIAALAGLAVFAAHIPRTLTIFGLAALVAFGVHPIVLALERRGVARGVAIALVYLGLLVVSVVVGLLVIPSLIEQLQDITLHLPAYLAIVQRWLGALEGMLRGSFGRAYLPPGYGDLRAFVAAKLAGGVGDQLASVSQLVLAAATDVGIAFSAFVLSAFFLIRARRILAFFHDLFPPEHGPLATMLASEMSRVFGGFVAGEFIVCGLAGVAVSIVTALFGFKFALLIGLLTAIGEAVPIFGQVVVHLLATILAAPAGAGAALEVNATIFVVLRVVETVIGPRVFAHSVGVSPIGIMFAVFAGGELFGVPGLVLGIPVAALVKVVWDLARASRVAIPVAPAPAGGDLVAEASVAGRPGEPRPAIG